MGGGGQANSGQASQAAAQQTAANQQDMALSAQNMAYQKQLMGTLFGTGQGTNQGSVGAMLDPSKLDSANLTGAYKSAYNQGTNQLSQDYANQKGSLAQGWANAGMGSGSTPSGFQADQQRQLGSSEADSRGQAFSSAIGAQHNEALSNFWNAANVANGQAASTGTGATTGAANSGSSSAAVYGTAGAYHPPAAATIAGSALQAGGTAGAAALCPTSGMRILLHDWSTKPVEELVKGDLVYGMDGLPDELVEVSLSRPVHVCDVSTALRTVRVSVTHTFERSKGGWVCAGSATNDVVKTIGGAESVTTVECLAEQQVCYYIRTKRAHGYVVEGFFSFE